MSGNGLPEEIAEDAETQTEDKNALTRSIHIATASCEVTITSQEKKENITKLKNVAVELMEKYSKKQDDRSEYR